MTTSAFETTLIENYKALKVSHEKKYEDFIKKTKMSILTASVERNCVWVMPPLGLDPIESVKILKIVLGHNFHVKRYIDYDNGEASIKIEWTFNV